MTEHRKVGGMNRLLREYNRAILGAVCLIAAVVVLIVGYTSIRDEVYVAIQLPDVLWSGAGAVLLAVVGIAAPGAAPALVTVDEYLKAHGREPSGLWFETSQVWTWPNRQAATSWHRYQFRGFGPRTELDFTWRYMLPGLGGAQVANAMRF